MASIVIGLNAVIAAVTNETPRILTVSRPEHLLAASASRRSLSADRNVPDALPFGPLDPDSDRTLELGLRRWVREQTGIELGYVEQLYTFGDRNRDPAEYQGGPRVISVAYLALVREQQLAGGGEASWKDWYEYFPWEDWRSGRPKIIKEKIAPRVETWTRDAPDRQARRQRQERAEITFGLGGARWDEERVLERYELLYEVALVEEHARDRFLTTGSHPSSENLGRSMALDHRRILSTALSRIRGKIKYRPVVFELSPSTFTLLQLQRVVEALAGIHLHKQNFRRLVEKGGLVEGTGQYDLKTGGRPAELFRFRREVLRERPAPGVTLPGGRKD